MINYDPLWHLLIEKKKDKTYLNEVIGINWRTISAMNRGDSVTVATLEKICLHFNEPIEKVLEIKKTQADKAWVK